MKRWRRVTSSYRNFLMTFISFPWRTRSRFSPSITRSMPRNTFNANANRKSLRDG